MESLTLNFSKMRHPHTWVSWLICIAYFLALGAVFSFLIYDCMYWDISQHSTAQNEYRQRIQDASSEAYIVLVFIGSLLFYFYASQQYPKWSILWGGLSLANI
jgi:hypothetical protein